MLIRVHQTVGYFTRSILQVRHVVDVPVETLPDEPDDFAAEHDGDYLEVETGEEDDE
jgi:hypothetical protein